jgi:hypothetical protein
VDADTGLFSSSVVVKDAGELPAVRSGVGNVALGARDVLQGAVSRVRYHVVVDVGRAVADATGTGASEVLLTAQAFHSSGCECAPATGFFRHIVAAGLPLRGGHDSVDDQPVEFDLVVENSDGLVPAGTVDVTVSIFASGQVGTFVGWPIDTLPGVGSASAAFEAELVEVAVTEEV